MKRKFTFLITAAVMLLTTMAQPGTAWGQTRTDATLNIQSYAAANNWSNGTKYSTATVSPVTFTANGGSNTGKYYTSGYEWRYYQTESASITISVPDDYTLSSITFTYNVTNTGVLKNGSDNVTSGSTVSVSGTSATFTVGNTGTATNGQVKFTNIVVTYTAAGGNPTVATPTFTPNGGSFLGSQEVSIACGTDGATVYYTLDGNEPTVSSTQYNAPFTIEETTTVKAIAVKDNYDNSEVATAVFTKETPMTVAEARDFIDNLNGATSANDVYVTGIISQIDSYNSSYHSITYWISDDGTTTDQLEVYSGKGLNGANFSAVTDLTTGSTVIVKGKVKLYGTTYEFTQNSQIVSLTLPESPYIQADDVEITYDTDADEIEYTINNPVAGGVLTASTTSDWLTLGNDFSSPIAFTCTANQAASSRTATVTLTYTYSAKATVTKDVTVTQSGNPNVFNNIEDITEVGTTYSVKGTVVAVNSKGFIMGDGTGYVYTYLNAAPTVAVGDMITVSGTTGSYGQVIQFTSTATIAEATSSNYDGTPEVTVINEVPDYSGGYHLATYLQFEGGLTKSGSNYLVAVGTSQIRISYPTTDQGNELEALKDKTVRVHGFFSGISGSGTNAVFTATMESVEEVVSTVPSVTVTPATIDAPAEGADGTVAITYENIPGLTDFDYHFCDAEGNELFDTDPNYPGDWIYAEINENNGAYSLDYIIDANDGDARTAYLFVFYESYSAIVTVNQAAYVAPSYAELPFSFNGGRADIEGTDGLTQEGLGTDYNATNNPNTKLKFDGTGDWLLLQFNERPGTLTFDIKNNSFSGGTFKLQTSVDGETFDDLKTYSDEVLIGTLNEEFTNLGENVRYIKWIYTEKSNGNVGLGNIALAKYSTPTASITVTPETVNVDASGEDDGSLAITYANLTITENDDFDIQFYDANNQPLDKADEPDWMIASVQATTTQDVYEVSYAVDPNDGAARTAYFKVYALDDDTNEVYSNLVTVTQDEYVAPIATITVTPETVNVETSGEDDGSLAIAYENLTITDPADFDIQYYNANNEPLDKPNEPTWLAVSVQAAATEGYVVSYSVDPNNGEARTAYFKVYALDNNSELVYSNLITINQAAYVVDYAELPFEWEGGPRSDFEALNGTSTYSVGDYGDNQGVYRMKLDATGDYIQIKTNEQPGVVTIGVKMIGGATSSTLTVQGSEDGSTFTNVEALTISGKQNDILTLTTTNNFEASDRYVRLLFTKGSNVGVGPISIAKVDLTPSIAITSPEEFDSNAHNDEELAVTYKNVDLTKTVSIAFFESDGETAATYEWITASINDDHNVAYSIEANTGAARTAYFKVIGKTSDDANVASNLVTISQAAPIPTFSITIATGIEHGTVEADKYTAEEGETVTLTATPVAGYVLNAWDVKDANNDPLEVTNNTFVMPASNVTVSATFIEAITYSLVTDASQIVSGKHYIIASSATDGTAYAMGDQSSNNRKGYAVTVANGIIAQTANVCEFVINTHENSNNETVYTIYDALNPGYLYASSSSANQLKTTTTLNDNGRWTIEVVNTGAATITAQGSNSRKLMRFNPNNNSPIFACYANSTTGNAPCLYVKVNDNDYEYYGSEITYTENTIPADETVTVGVGSVMTVPSTFTNTNPANLIIEDGGQLIHDGDVSATIQLNVTGYGRDNSGYKLIASPVQTNLNVETETNLLNGTYDLYVFDEGQTSKEWRNYRASAFTTIDNEKGYLYANASNITVTFSGELRPSNEDVTINLEYTTGNRFAGWNLVGNPFACNAYIKDATDNITAYYRMNAAGNNYVAATGAIAPMEGIFVQASAASQHFKFTREVPTTNSGHGNLNIQVAQTVADRDSQPAIDNAIIRFDGGNTLEKFCFRDDNSKLYIPQGNKDYAVVNAQAQGEIPVNFKAVEDGTYTIDFSMENIEFGYLHLFDNMTGMDVDLLQTPSYTFEGKQTDYASRFRLVFSANSDNESFGEGNGDFGFISNGNLVILGIEGEATLQVIDVTGRVLSSETFSGSYNKAVNASAGVYMIRLINGNDVKTQKIVVR